MPKRHIFAAGFCARAMRGTMTAVLTRRVMNSRRSISFPRAEGYEEYHISGRVNCTLWHAQPGRCSCPLWIISGHWGTSKRCPLYPQKRTFVAATGTSALCQKRTRAPQQKHHYSMTSSASCCRSDGKLRPSALAVLKLITSSNLLGRSMGSSLGFAPERIRVM